MKGKTYHECGNYYAVIVPPNGFEYYVGPFKSRSTAYRYSVRVTDRCRRRGL